MTEKAQRVLRQIERQAESDFLPIIGPAKGRYLVEALKKVKAHTVLEVGALVGYSTILMADNLPAGGMLHTIEINPKLAFIAAENVRLAGLSRKVEIHAGDALEVIPTLDLKLDLLFVDAAKDEYLKYLKLAEHMLHPGSAVFADNAGVFARDMQDYLEYVRTSGKYASEFHRVGSDGVEISTRL
jgi:predicted O-methyltransferase YrrM